MIRRILSAVLACGVVAAALLLWELSRGPLSLNFVTPYLRDALHDAEGDWRLEIDDLVLMSDFKVHARTVSLLDRQGQTVLQVPDLVLRPSLSGLLHGFLAVGGVELSGAEASVVRRADGTFGVSIAGVASAPVESASATTDLIEELLQPSNTQTAIGFLHRVRIRDARINVDDVESRASFSIQELNIGLARSDSGQELTVRAALTGKDDRAPTKLEAQLDAKPNGDGFILQGQAKAAPIDVSRLEL
jgi:hypothetical protein